MPNFILDQYFIALLITGLVHLALALIVLSKGITKRLNQTYALYSICIAIWSIFEAFGITRQSETLALWLWRLNHAGVIFITIFFVHFVYILLNIQGRKRKLIPISYALGLIFLILDATPLLILEVVPKFSFRYFINPGAVYYVFFTLWVTWAIYGLFELFRELYKAEGYRKNQLKYFCWSMLVAYVGGIPNFFPTFNIEIPFLMPYGTYAISIYAFFTAYAIIRFRLMDIRLAVTRTALSIVIFGTIAAAPYIILFPFRSFLYDAIGKLWWLLPTSISVFGLIAATAPFTYLYFQRKIEDRLLREDRVQHKILHEFSKNVVLIRNIDKLLNSIVNTLSNTLGIKHVVIYLYNKDAEEYILQAYNPPAIPTQRLERGSHLINLILKRQKPILYEEIMNEYKTTYNNKFVKPLEEMKSIAAAAIIPNFIDEDLIGFIGLGEEKRSNIYSQDDIDVLTTLANQSALAIRNAQLNRELAISETRRLQNEKFATIGRLATSAKHEVGNPLTTISLNIQALLMKKNLDPKLKSTIDTIYKQTKRIESVLEDMYALPKKIEEKLQPLFLDELITGSFELARWQTYWESLSGVDLERIYPKDLPKIKGNATLLQSAFLNLITNAYQAMSDAELIERKITIKAKPDSSNKFLMIEFSNKGPLIPEEDLGQIFDFQHSTKGSSGMGLYIVRRIIEELHHGEIEVKNVQNYGVLFKIKLPIWRA